MINTTKSVMSMSFLKLFLESAISTQNSETIENFKSKNVKIRSIVGGPKCELRN